MLEQIGKLAPQTRAGQLALSLAVGSALAVNMPELSLSAIAIALAGRWWLNYRNNDIDHDDVVVASQPVKPQDNIGLLQTLAEYGLDGASIISVSEGSVLDRYIVKLPPGTSKKDIPDDDDIAMSLGVKAVTISPANQRMCKEFDVPRRDRMPVDFDALLASGEWQAAKASNMRLPVCPAVTVDGKPWIIDLADGVHYFIAGTTGAGKSVFANAIMLSLMDSGRDFVLMVADGKNRLGDFYPHYIKSSHLLNSYRDMVEGEPECVGAAIEPEDMASQFEWLVWKMEQRFSGADESSTPIIYLMDEMKDVVDMLSASDDKNALKAFTRNVGRLAQKARSVNITILFCTQSPNSEWLPQTLRAVIPSAIGLAVASGAQSRVCIGEVGGEKLLGRGDAIAKIGGTTTRVHGAMVTDKHLHDRVV